MHIMSQAPKANILFPAQSSKIERVGGQNAQKATALESQKPVVSGRSLKPQSFDATGRTRYNQHGDSFSAGAKPTQSNVNYGSAKPVERSTDDLDLPTSALVAFGTQIGKAFGLAF
jgi:hypothetical protein